MRPHLVGPALLLLMTLASCGGDGGREAAAPAPSSPSPTASPAPTPDPADKAACGAFADAMSPTLDLIAQARQGKALAPVIVSAIAGAAEERASRAADAATPPAAAAMRRAAANAGLMSSAAKATQGGPLDIAAETESTLDAIRAALAYCSTG